ncbi:hypothetical protein AAY80_003 [Stenotrophomonas phage vB_SmaS-DLP_6]|nr:hypothetical protein AAY80_003 [Stenotrophomonas phage vB_SmaS-DLP_6]
MNALIIAQHHGVFLTLESLRGKVDQIVVVIPQSQLNKYAEFPEPEFKAYGENLKAYCKKHKIECWTTMALESPRALLESINKTGKWAVLAAGSLYQEFDEQKLVGYATAACVGRVYERDNRLAMYHMVGLPAEDTKRHLQNHFLNLDMQVRDRTMSNYAVARPDPLIGQAISAVECVRLRSASKKSAVLAFWMTAISRTTTQQEYVAYPLDEYAQYAKKVKKLLPVATYEAIMENASESSRWRAFADLEP